MKKLLGAVLALVVIGGAAYGGWVYAGKPDLLGGRGGPSTSSASLSPEAAALTKKYEAILKENYVSDAGKETPASDIAALLPDGVSLTVENSTFDAASGATIWTGVALTAADNAELGLAADEVKLWGFDADAISARVAGSNLSETVQIAERIEAKGVKTLGLETLFTEIFLAYVESVSNTIEAVAPEEGISDADLAEMRAAMEMVVDRYEFEVDSIVAVGPQLRAWEYQPIDIEAAIESGSDEDAGLVVVQKAAAYYRAIGFDHLIWSDTEFSMVMAQDGIKQDVVGGYDFVAYSGWYGGDLESSIMTGLRMTQDMDMREMFAELEPDTEGAPELFERMKMDITVASGGLTGMKLDKVLRLVAMGEWPGTNQTDLMAYGRFDMQGLDLAFNDASFVALEEMVLDLSSWHWFIPNAGEVTLNGLTYDIDGIFNLMRPAMQEADPDGLKVTMQAMDIMKKYEFLPLIYDQSFIWDWDAETGAFSLKSPQHHRKFGKANFEVSGTLPTYDEAVAAAKADIAADGGDPFRLPGEDTQPWPEFPEPGEEVGDDLSDPFELDLDFAPAPPSQFELLFAEKFAVTGGFLELEDQGGLDKIFPMISEIGKLSPDEFGPMMANSTPEAMRGMAVSAIGVAAIEAGTQEPRAEKWIMPFSDWIRDGGTITLRVDPSEPLGPRLEEKYPNPDPEQIVEILGITVTHEKP